MFRRTCHIVTNNSPEHIIRVDDILTGTIIQTSPLTSIKDAVSVEANSRSRSQISRSAFPATDRAA